MVEQPLLWDSKIQKSNDYISYHSTHSSALNCLIRAVLLFLLCIRSAILVF